MKCYLCKTCLFVAIILTITSCARTPYDITNKKYRKQAKALTKTIRLTEPVTLTDSAAAVIPSDWVGTVNFGLRKPNYVIIHYTAQKTAQETLTAFTDPKREVSAHYVIGRDGKIYHMLNDYLRAWHAGVAKWGNNTDVNSSSIGIELDNTSEEPFAPAQINSLLALLTKLKKAYNIPTANFIGHSDIAPPRKQDPGVYFPWKTLAKKGFGLWYDDTLIPCPDDMDIIMALRIVGYDTSDLKSAIIAFKRHFIQTNIDPQFSGPEMDVLYNLYRKY
ncbi:N-acetylmuramoyl-L-alanine amidase [Mucilaginibacter sp. HMF5004]|uniref:N-acetylmuramoyl-L-alanine amidase n=1 Tax=Mucilaginibacter rivuli TaxID=2857527 RepID=UPI001C5DE2BB|nr:N-acetylmuramoyl-L-alanine amidase [Mucilaginibacter rivuli]MBW4888593.1 N-acetylmuramoyl-L-alanine amidase [Mucilaginibacter rivuli]